MAPSLLPFLALQLLFGGDPFDYFRNSWATVGLKDYPAAARITPENEVLLGGGRRVRLAAGAAWTPIGPGPVKTLLEGGLPVVLLESREGPVRYGWEIWASPLPTAEWRAALAWPVAGENFLVWFGVEARNEGPGPARAGFRVELAGEGGAETASLPAVLSWELAPAAVVRAWVPVPYHPLPPETVLDPAAGELWRERTVAFWREVLAGGARLEVPEPRAMACLKASHVNQLIGSDRGELRAGEGFYDAFYIRDGAYQLLHLLEAGFLAEARRAMPAFLHCQRSDGRFESQKGQLDANGQALWALWRYYQITADREWLAGVLPAMLRAAAWVRDGRERVGAWAGLLPAAPADGEFLWDGRHHIVGYDLWNLRGLECAAAAAAELGEAGKAGGLAALAREYRGTIDAAWERTGLGHLPPSWEGAGTHWGNTETLWPRPLFARSDPRVRAMVDEARRHFGGGFWEGTIRWCPGRVAAIHPYLTAYTTMASLDLGEREAVVGDFFWCLLHSSAAGSFPEGVYPRRRFAWGDTAPHLLGAANYAVLLRHLLVHEEGEELHLLKAVPDGWLAPGREVRLERAPTCFGALSLRVAGLSEGLEVELDLPRRRPPARVILHVPAGRKPRGLPAGVEVAAHPPLREPWCFDYVVERWRAESAPRPLQGLAALPLAVPPPRERLRFLDLKAVANTDPFAAPFGAVDPGKFLFSGLKTGEVVAAGVPFQILDPARNQGRGFVVLQGMGTSAGFPREVEIPVGAPGRRLFLLGAVHGWLPEDEGAGPAGALAEFVVEYEDGTTQAIPLIAGRTTDDWARAPGAAEATVGLQGEPWHLNVLGVELRPVAVRRLLFRDLGTASSPVLAAATLEGVKPTNRK